MTTVSQNEIPLVEDSDKFYAASHKSVPKYVKAKILDKEEQLTHNYVILFSWLIDQIFLYDQYYYKVSDPIIYSASEKIYNTAPGKLIDGQLFPCKLLFSLITIYGLAVFYYFSYRMKIISSILIIVLIFESLNLAYNCYSKKYFVLASKKLGTDPIQIIKSYESNDKFLEEDSKLYPQILFFDKILWEVLIEGTFTNLLRKKVSKKFIFFLS